MTHVITRVGCEQMSLGTALAQEADAPEEAEAGGESDPLLLSRCASKP